VCYRPAWHRHTQSLTWCLCLSVCETVELSVQCTGPALWWLDGCDNEVDIWLRPPVTEQWFMTVWISQSTHLLSVRDCCVCVCVSRCRKSVEFSIRTAWLIGAYAPDVNKPRWKTSQAVKLRKMILHEELRSTLTSLLLCWFSTLPITLHDRMTAPSVHHMLYCVKVAKQVIKIHSPLDSLTLYFYVT